MNKIVCCLFSAFLIAGCASSPCTSDIHVVQLAKSTRSWDGQPLPAYTTGKPEITILKITIPPKQTLPRHYHPFINAGILISGELTVTTDNGHVLHMKPSDPIIEVVDTWHYGVNEGNEPAVIVVFYAGQKGEPITIKKQQHEQSSEEK